MAIFILIEFEQIGKNDNIFKISIFFPRPSLQSPLFTGVIIHIFLLYHP